MSHALCYATWIKEDTNLREGIVEKCVDPNDKEMIQCFNSAVKLLNTKIQATSGKLSIQMLFASAFVRIFLCELVGILHSGQVVNVNTRLATEALCKWIDGKTTLAPRVQTSIAIYALREFRHRHRIQMMQVKTVACHVMPVLESNFPWPADGQVSRLGVDPFTGIHKEAETKAETKNDNEIIKDKEEDDIMISKVTDLLQEIRHGNQVEIEDMECFARVILSQSYLDNIDSSDAKKNIAEHLNRGGKKLLGNLVSFGIPLEVTGDSSYDDIVLLSLVSQCALLLPGTLCPLAAIITKPEELLSSFVVASKSDPRIEILQHQLEMKQHQDDKKDAYWRCRNNLADGNECGEIYAIDACGETHENEVCRNCGTDIGNVRNGTSHTPAAYQERLTPARVQALKEKYEETKGWEFHQSESIKSPIYRCRGMSPVSFRMLHMTTKVCLMLARMNDKNFVLNMWSSLYQDLSALQHLCSQLSPEALTVAMHSCIIEMTKMLVGTNGNGLLMTARDRALWENSFTTAIAPILNSNNTEALDQRFRLRTHVTNALETTIDNQCDNWMGRIFLPDVFQVLSKPSFAILELKMQDRQLYEEYPLLKLWIERQDSLWLLRHLHPLLDWPLFLRKHCSWSFARKDFENMTVQDLISQPTEEDEEEFKEDATKLYVEFAKAWNAIESHQNGEPLRFGCDEDTIPELPLDIKSAYLGSREGGHTKFHLFAILFKLATIQSDFLKLADQHIISSDPSVASSRPAVLVGKLGCDNAKGSASKVIKPRSPSYFVSKLLMQLKLASSQSRMCEFDHTAQEDLIRRFLVNNKVIIKVPNREQMSEDFGVLFKGEGFIKMKRLFSRVRNQVGHNFPFPGEDYIRKSDLSKNVPKVASLLLSIESVFLCIVNEADGSFGGETELQEFCSQHMEQSESIGILSMENINLKSLKLKHMICLYEVLEDMCSDHIVQEGSQAIPIHYRDDSDQLSLDMQAELEQFCLFLTKQGDEKLTGSEISFRAATFLEATFRRFLRHYLTNEQSMLDPVFFNPDASLKDEYGDIHFDLWSPVSGKPEDEFEKFFPDSFCLKHIFHAQQHLRSRLDEVKLHRMQAEDDTYDSRSSKKVVQKKGRRGGKSSRQRRKKKWME